MEQVTNIFKIYTDGGVMNNGAENNIGSVGVVFVPPGEKEEIKFKRGYRNTTNNRMELQACIIGLRHIPGAVTTPVQLYSDSAYVVNAFKQDWITNWEHNGWRTSSGGEVKNRDLWEELIRLYKQHTNVEFVKVKGHNGDKYNEIADSLATEAMREMEA